MFAHIWQGRLVGLRLVMIVAVGALLLIGLASIYATGRIGDFRKQLMWIALGGVAFMLVNVPHYRLFGRVAYGLFALSVGLLIMLLVGKYLHLNSLVPVIHGSARWIKLLPLPIESAIVRAARIQPSELTKITYILALAWYLRHRKNYRTLRGLIGPFALTVLPMALILLQPDLGTVMLFVPVLFAVLFVAGTRVGHLLAVVGTVLALSPLFYTMLEPYQKERIAVLIKQSSDDPYWLRGTGYQLHQSKICIGSGQLTGHGWREGTFVRYKKFLPHRHNDFIFALIAHQWGLLGGAVVLGLYALIIICGIEIAARQIDPFGRLVAVGISTLIATQMFINVGVTIGLMPVTGLNLPFVSYGGSSLLANFLALGLLANTARHRPHQIANKPFEFDDE